MPAFPRTELDAMVEHWLEANRRCEAAGDWRPLADLYTEDATYGWNVGPGQDFMAVGRAEIRDIALGAEMGGLDGWSYPYQAILVDERRGEVVGFWKQVADARRPDGTPYEVAGIGGSWFRYAGDMRWSWQRDWFDLGNVTSVFVEMMKAGALSDGMRRRLDRAAAGGPLPGYYPHGEAPVSMW
ncbi:nuclear transport factor 2 family protein [Actinomadura logoneensis]|uniref:Nuclear transport factor 2 family protein n=1 Tax=Actinomadura logoneensis TaxID=2293572 RepID=A0A372JIH3_9ACTN|nr:nuclear transport factor 2 family protein [Actinomadura logoneensis]RFU39803.1 nuclear transport factor 2 family protein [Actinomadura logoneensis]